MNPGVVVNQKEIDLRNYDSNITIDQGGEYTITGSFSYSILVDAPSDVTLHFNNVTVQSTITAAVANLSEHTLTIDLVSGTTNVLSDGGSSVYDACLYSKGPLLIEGTGTLSVYGNQEEGEGIATETNSITIREGNLYIESNDDGVNAGGDGGLITIQSGNIVIQAGGDGIDSNQNVKITGGTIYTMGAMVGGDASIDTDLGFTIDGGTVIGLGSDMLEAPMEESLQKTICWNLDTMIAKGTLITLVNEKEEVILSFEAMENFQTLLISAPTLVDGKYSLYQGGSVTGEKQNGIVQVENYTKGELIIVGGATQFDISKSVTEFGHSMKK